MLKRIDSVILAAVAALVAGCVDGGPGYVPTFTPMDASPYMNSPAPAQTQTQMCANGRIVPYPGPCPL